MGSTFCSCWERMVSVCCEIPVSSSRTRASTNLEVLVGGLLVFAGQCAWRRGSEVSNDAEDHARDTDGGHGVHEHPGVLALGCLCAGTVWAESDPVCCAMLLVMLALILTSILPLQVACHSH